jgi:Fe2+ transport system protein B
MKCMPAVEQSIVVIGKESVGKSQLISSLTGHMARSGNFRGTTVSCDVYRDDENTFIDTPGIMRESDSVTTRLALEQLCVSERVLLVVKATRLDDDLADLLPLARGKQGLVAVTFWDKLDHTQSATSALDRLSESSGSSSCQSMRAGWGLKSAAGYF